MELTELKEAWIAYDKKLQSTRSISEKIINSMIAERSKNRWTKVSNQYKLGFVWMSFWIIIGFAILLGNPFDYQYHIQYVPIVIYMICISIGLTGMIRAYNDLQKIQIDHTNVYTALQQIISIYERPKKFEKWTLIILIFSSGVLFPLSFIPQRIHDFGLLPALLERVVPIAVFAALFFIALKVGAFKERSKEKFKADLNDLDELKATCAELKDE